jgi:uncharacterized protein YdhG (YjbR/CyaY superfamily)
MNNGNFLVNRSVLNYIHARDFFPKGDAENYRLAVKDLIHFDPMSYGREIPEFNMVFPEDDMLLGAMIGEKFVKLEDSKTGTFRRPWNNVIHFEEFDDLSEWRLAVALEDTTFTTYSHISGAKTALDGYQFDYNNLEEWIVETVINIRQNDAVFYRPWVFHSFEEKLIFCHYIRGEA